MLAASKWVLGTIMLASHPFADTVKRRLDVNLVELNRANYEAVLDGLRSWLESRLTEE